MKKMYFVFISLLLCAVLCFSACSSAKLSNAKMDTLREEYPLLEYYEPENISSLPLYVTGLDWYIDQGATVSVVVELTDDYTVQPFKISPVDNPDQTLLIPATNLVYLPVKVETVLAGTDSTVTEGMQLYLHLGSAEFFSKDELSQYHKGARFTCFLIPSIGRLDESLSAKNIYSATGLAYVTNDNYSMHIINRPNVINDYSGCTIEEYQKALQKTFQEYEPGPKNNWTRELPKE